MNPTSNPTPLSTRIAARTLHRWFASAVAICLMVGTFSAWGATKTWTGGASPDANWSAGGNWSPSGAPSNGDDLVFPSGPTSLAPTHDMALLTSINSVTISLAGYDITATSGGTLTLAAGFTNNAGSGVANWRINLALGAHQTFTVINASGSMAFFGTLANGGFYLTNNATGNMDMSGTISGTGGMVKNGSGTLKISNLGNNTYTGKTLVSAGTLYIIQETSIGGNPASLIADQLKLDGGTLQAGLDFAIDDSNRGLTLGAGGGTISVDAEKTLEIKKIIAGTGNLTKTGPGVLKLSTATSTYTGKTIVSDGTLAINNESRLGSNPASDTADQLKIQNGATLNIFGNVTLDDSKRGVTLGTGGGIISVDESILCEIKRPIAGAGSLTKAGLGSLKLSTASNTYTGRTIISEGDLQIDSQLRLGANPATFAADQLTINGGAMLYALADVLVDDSNRGVTLAGGTATVSVDSGFILEIANKITGSGALTKTGDGALKLSVANTYDGKTTVSVGTLSIDDEDRLGNNPGTTSGDQLTIAGGTLNAYGSFTLDDSNRGILLGAGGGTITVSDTFALTIANPIGDASGAIALTKAGLGTLTLSTANTYSGATLLNEGRLNVNGSLVSGSAVTVAAGATLGGTGTAAGSVAANGTLAPGNSVESLDTGAQDWNSGGSYEIEINDATGTAGVDPGWDLLNISGALTINATSGSKFTIKVISLSGSSAGNAAHFDNAQSYSWRIATASGGVSLFAADKFTLDTSGFSNNKGAVGAFSISQSGNNVYLNFTPIFANAAPYGRAWGTYARIPVSDLLTYTTGNTTRALVSVATGNQGTTTLISGGMVLVAPTHNSTETFQYVAQLTGYATSLATNTITLSVTNAVSATRAIINSSGSTVTATFFGMPGFKYQVQRTLSLSPVSWVNYGAVQTADGSTGKLVITDTVANGSSAWYRLVQAPE